jgi:hypothetical protein
MGNNPDPAHIARIQAEIQFLTSLVTAYQGHTPPCQPPGNPGRTLAAANIGAEEVDFDLDPAVGKMARANGWQLPRVPPLRQLLNPRFPEGTNLPLMKGGSNQALWNDDNSSGGLMPWNFLDLRSSSFALPTFPPMLSNPGMPVSCGCAGQGSTADKGGGGVALGIAGIGSAAASGGLFGGLSAGSSGGSAGSAGAATSAGCSTSGGIGAVIEAILNRAANRAAGGWFNLVPEWMLPGHEFDPT